MRRGPLFPAIAIAALVLPLTAAGQYQIAQSVVGCGAGGGSGPGNELLGTIGQAVIGVTTGPSNANEIGFWYQPGWILTGVPGSEFLPPIFSLGQNCPNPFNPVTTITFAAPEPARVCIKLYDVIGREVRTLADGEYEAGYHRVVLDGDGLASGVYFCRMVSGSFEESKKLILLK
jgi:hypothetical protein